MNRSLDSAGRTPDPGVAHTVGMTLLGIGLLAVASALPPRATYAQGDTPADGSSASSSERCLAADAYGAIDAYPIEIDGSLEADEASSRVDFYRFEATPGLTLQADMTDQASEPTTMANPLLGLFDGDCKLIDFNDDLVAPGIVSLDARLAFTVPDDGVFFLAAAASPDSGFDGSSDDTGTYTLWIDRDPPLPLDAIEVIIVRGKDDRVQVNLPADVRASGYNVYRDGVYVTTVRPPDEATSFSIDGTAGNYCVVVFLEVLDETRYSPCSRSVMVGPNGLEAGPPGVPRALRARVYSRGVAELFWDPAIDDGYIVAYRVVRNGTEVAYRHAGSYFTVKLDPTRLYRYRVTAIDNDGNEGAPARLELRAANTGQLPPPAGAGDGIPPAPPGPLRTEVYSPGVLEIFWPRSPDHAALAGYEVWRDGVRVAFHTGASHFEPRLSPRRTHDFAVIAVDAAGYRSEAVTLRVSPVASGSLISRESHADLLAHAFELFVGDVYNKPFLAFQTLDLSSALISETRDPDDRLRFHFLYDCEIGTAELDLRHTASNEGDFYRWFFDGCLQDGLRHGGDLSQHVGSFVNEFSAESFSWQADSGRTIAFSGYGAFSPTKTRADNRHSWMTRGIELDSHTADGSLILGAMSTQFGYETGGPRQHAWMSGSFTVSSRFTNGTLMHVSTPVAFGSPATRSASAPPRGWNFTQGQLELIAEDGSRLLLDADTGDVDTVSITLVNDLGVDTFESPWAPWQARLRFDRYPNEFP